MSFKIIPIMLAGLLLCQCQSDTDKSIVSNLEGLAFDQMKYPYQEKSFNFQGHNIVYIDSGSGPPLIFLHGQASDLLNFDPAFSLFVAQYRVIALDYPGFGKSDKPEISFSEEFLVGMLDKLFKTVNIESATLIGHSYGGYVAMVYGSARPEQVNSMVLISPAGIQKFNSFMSAAMRKAFTVEAIMKTSMEKAMQNYHNSSANWSPEMETYALRRVALLKAGNDEYQRYAHAMVQAMELMLDTTVRDRIGTIDVPILLLWGQEDSLIPLKVADEALKYIPDAQLETMENCGHFPMLEYPQEFHRLVQAFLKSVS